MEEVAMNNFTARKIRTITFQKFQAPRSKVFPLLCPVREYEWIEPWNCEMLHSDSGIAEKNCVFRTGSFGEPSRLDLPGEPSSDVWVISHYEPDTRIEFVRMNALRTACLSVTLTDNGNGTSRSLVEQLTVGLTEQGNQSLEDIAENFSFEWRMGEAMLNHYLTTGKMLPLQDAVAIASEQT
jgi:hypothetical protein